MQSESGVKLIVQCNKYPNRIVLRYICIKLIRSSPLQCRPVSVAACKSAYLPEMRPLARRLHLSVHKKSTAPRRDVESTKEGEAVPVTPVVGGADSVSRHAPARLARHDQNLCLDPLEGPNRGVLP